MKINRLLFGAGLAAALLVGGVASPALASDDPGLTAFGSAAELDAFLAAHAPQDPECPPDQPDCLDTQVDEIVVTASRVAATAVTSITNNQEAGVDEGDIVKARGDTLIILRRGRLFTVDTARGRLRLVDTADAFPPGADASGDWYDEMLVSGDRVIVIGYSYERGGTEINRFQMDEAGNLTFEDSHHLSSDDYYSSRNYASRLVGDQLVVYSPVEASTGEALQDLPRLKRWIPDAAEDGDDYEDLPGTPIITAQDVYVAPGMDRVQRWDRTFHTTIRCDLDAPELTCRATAILGPESRSFYVAPTAVYVWMAQADWNLPKGERPRAWLYRVPLDGARPQAAATQGTPIDQFSFLEQPELNRINVMVVSDGEGDGMWGPERARGSAALLQLPFSRFGDGTAALETADYRILPAVGSAWRAQNRFVGDFLFYSAPVQTEEGMAGSRVIIAPLAAEGASLEYGLPGRVSRIEIMGPDALVVSGAVDTLFTTFDLQGPRPVISDQLVMPGSGETESRSHAFFYRPDPSSPDGSTGVLGLPVSRLRPAPNDKDADATRRLETIGYIRRNEAGRLGEIGSLDATPSDRQVDDGCQASCYSWYGDARPIFLRDRIFALLGYEIIEGRERGGRIREVRRIDMTPPTPPGPRPYYPEED